MLKQQILNPYLHVEICVISNGRLNKRYVVFVVFVNLQNVITSFENSAPKRWVRFIRLGFGGTLSAEISPARARLLHNFFRYLNFFATLEQSTEAEFSVVRQNSSAEKSVVPTRPGHCWYIYSIGSAKFASLLRRRGGKIEANGQMF